MFLKSTFAATASAAALVLASLTSAAPTSSNYQPDCKSIGKGAFGYNSSAIGIYSNKPPQTYLTVASDNNRLIASTVPDYQEQTLFEFFNCSYKPAPYVGKGAIDTYQGYIKAPNGECVTVADTSSSRSYVLTSPCKFNSDKSYGNVDPSQHFQFQTDTFYSFYSVVFLSKVHGPVDTNSFGSGAHYHFSISDKKRPYLISSHQPSNPQDGKLNEMLIAQIGDEYKPTTKTFPACKVVKTGNVELVNTQTGAVHPVTTDYGHQFPYAQTILIGGTGNPSFSFLECDSEYMGYKSDSTNTYGHFKSNEFDGEASCFTKQTGGDLNDLILESQVNGNPPEYDTKDQIPAYFRMQQTSDGYYQLNYLGGRASDNVTPSQWMPKRDASQSDDVTTVFVDASNTGYTLRFTKA
ncbi:hypothetical protein PHSY_001915 [Pseudozyma hubeiensis SY62]|uniref:Secreted protein n=1 Tax=Pseudozyma hubeiensis (strain SY62) TaxID=1305764 RepID=R9NZX9_PSEHS|nr:hypothetical protein PHSY_001915 [Pseudozyma hubeiensis SY62]GAC94344.1 hypothetical protein PHSY_001915 [Pseudozyma hubeiensis SY62]